MLFFQRATAPDPAGLILTLADSAHQAAARRKAMREAREEIRFFFARRQSVMYVSPDRIEGRWIEWVLRTKEPNLYGAS